MGLSSSISSPDSRNRTPASRYNRTIRHEWLDQYIIEIIEKALDHATQWLWLRPTTARTSLSWCATIAGQRGSGAITPAMKRKMAA